MSITKSKKVEKLKSQMVALKPLRTDRSYQREIKQDLIQTIRNNWHDIAAGAIILSRRKDGSLWIVDGQHRVAAAQMLKMTRLPAIIIEGLTIEQEAELRIELTTRKSDTPGEKFKARLVANEPKALSILEIASSLDVKIALDRQKGDSVNALSALEYIWDVDKGVTLKTILKIIKDARGVVNQETASRTNLLMLKWFMEHHVNEMERKRLLYVLRMSAAAIIAKAEENKVHLGGALWVNQYRVLIDLYNEGQPEATKLTEKLKGHGKSTVPKG